MENNRSKKGSGGIWVLDDGEFEFFRNVVYRESGIRLSDLKKALVQARLTKRLRLLQMRDFPEYCEYVKEHYNDEIVNLINCITTNKTDFFRENRHFEYMASTVFPGWAEMKKHTVRIWSAGCSTGEEPYTIAIVTMENFADAGRSDIKILATDIDTNVIEKGRSGIYSLDNVSDMDLGLMKKYFMRGRGTNEGLFMVKDQVRRLVHFRRLNLQDDKFPMKGKFDIIFCRNVIIYFDRDTQKNLFEKFHSFLHDDGYLFVGHSETLTGLTNRFRLVSNSIYRKVT